MTNFPLGLIIAHLLNSIARIKLIKETEEDLMLRQMSPEELLACRSKVYQYVYRLMARWPDRFQIVEDITQQTFVRAWEKEKDFRGDCKVSTWLCIIARNLYKDFIRYKTRQRIAGDLWLDELTFGVDFDDDKINSTTFSDNQTELLYVERIDADKQARDLLRLLDGESRRLMILWMHGLSAKEISSITHLPTILIKSRLHCIRVKLVRLAA